MKRTVAGKLGARVVTCLVCSRSCEGRKGEKLNWQEVVERNVDLLRFYRNRLRPELSTDGEASQVGLGSDHSTNSIRSASLQIPPRCSVFTGNNELDTEINLCHSVISVEIIKGILLKVERKG
jgi:hypothetical protein